MTDGKHEDFEEDNGYKKFTQQIPIADFSYYSYTWPAWFVLPGKKEFVPVIRLAISDFDGNILLKRETLITALVDLVQELSANLLKDAEFIGQFEGYSIDVPENKENVVEGIEQSIEMLQSTKKYSRKRNGGRESLTNDVR